ncbi:MAG: hypothetical protein ABJN95_16980 [Maribacter sp.]|uniref:hypothetical protein n=1 Tax=Maribacter sp. TaxID=1897614 RepID=UPI0032973923
MKFNSVEISGFRIYDHPEDANFNFVTEDGETADFVSLFAPNGFGKTSFYDAVEWAVTNNIERFWVNSYNTKSSLSMLRQLNPKQIKLLKNYNTTNDVWVKIMDSNNEEFQNRDLKVPGQRHYDINKDGQGKENVDFLSVILSQEWISRFLKEANGHLRYQKFMESNPSLNKIDLYYQNVIALSNANDRNIASIEKNITEFQERIKETSEEDLLTTINNQIDNVNKFELSVALNKIEVVTTKKEITDFRDALSDIIADDSEVNRLEKLLSHITLAQNGTTDFLSCKQYFEAIKNLTAVVKQKKAINNNLLDFKKLEATNNEIDQKEKSKVEKTVQLKELRDIQKLVPAFNEALSKIISKNELKNKHQEQLKKLKTDIEESNRQLIEDEGASKKFERQRLEVTEGLGKIPQLKKNLAALEKTIKSLNEKLDSQRTKTAKSQTSYSKFEVEIDELVKVIQEFDLGQYSEISLGKNQEQIKNLKLLETLEEEGLQLKKELKSVQQSIDSQESLNKSLNEFIASGLDIVNEQETNTCPLCEQAYENYQTLADRVMNNDALSASIKSLLEERTKKQNEIDNNRDSKNKPSEEIQQFYTDRLDDLQSQLKLLGELKEDDQNLLNEITKQLNTESEKLLDLKSDFQEDTIDAFEKGMKIELDVILASKKSSEEQIVKNEIVHQKLESDRNELSGKITLLDREIKELRNDKDYNKVDEWLDFNKQSKENLVDFFNSKVGNNEDESKALDDALANLQNDLKALTEKLKKLKEKQLKEDLTEIDSKLQEMESLISIYQNHLKENLSISPEGLTSEVLNSTLKDKGIEMKDKLGQYQKSIIEIKKLKGYSENIVPYLQSEQAKLKLAISKEELKFLKDRVKESLGAEIEKTKSHLDERIKAFFYENLINEIYSKIDPHPSFKKVEFIVTFDNENPSLDVILKGSQDDNSEDNIIPNLYFSTAQINILSLSIFLASALNSKTYDCIFIDDPIQSMDSINVLSTIDLLRSIVVNNKKQIILSTHDENFHNLLKMKIPSKLFKSKFLELESFGKLKSSPPTNTAVMA